MGAWVMINAGWYKCKGGLGAAQSLKRTATGEILDLEAEFGIG
jgi:hypothetical protein